MDANRITEKIKQIITSRKTIISANILLIGYEVFFTLSVCELLPGLGTHFGAGLGDLVFTFITLCIPIIHMLGLLVCFARSSRTFSYIILLAVCLLPLIGLHAIAFEGNLNGHSRTHAYGLYYDRLKVWEKKKNQSPPKQETFMLNLTAR